MSGTGEGRRGRISLSLDQLIALNDEIVALSRAGMPIERGLMEIGSDLPGRLREITTRIGRRMQQGESLPDAMDSLGAGVPRVYRAVVEAGTRSGQLSVALEGMVTYARSFSEARRAIGLALWYPLTVLALATILFAGILAWVVPRFLSAFETLDIAPGIGLGILGEMRAHFWLWAPIVPLFLCLVLVAWVGSRRAPGFGNRRVFGVLRLFPWLGRMLVGYEAASYADVLALLFQNGVPYPEALVLAGQASGDPSLGAASESLAAAIREGQAPSEALKGRSAFPPLLRSLLAYGASQKDFAASLRAMADRYRSEARRQSDKIRVFLPIILLLTVGATVTILYALTLFVPLTTLWTDLAEQTT